MRDTRGREREYCKSINAYIRRLEHWSEMAYRCGRLASIKPGDNPQYCWQHQPKKT